MKKWWPLIALAVVIMFSISKYNTIVEKEGVSKAQWANVESAYQRRADLIPNLVNTVKGYAAHESETLEAVIKARSEATSTKIDANNLTPEKMQQFQKAQQGLSGALGRLMVIAEKYPDLKANTNFLELQSQLEGTENRINVERNRFNGMAGGYNIYIKKFPTNITARLFGFDPLSLYKASEGSEKAPEVKF